MVGFPTNDRELTGDQGVAWGGYASYVGVNVCHGAGPAGEVILRSTQGMDGTGNRYDVHCLSLSFLSFFWRSWERLEAEKRQKQRIDRSTAWLFPPDICVKLRISN